MFSPKKPRRPLLISNVRGTIMFPIASEPVVRGAQKMETMVAKQDKVSTVALIM